MTFTWRLTKKSNHGTANKMFTDLFCRVFMVAHLTDRNRQMGLYLNLIASNHFFLLYSKFQIDKEQYKQLCQH